MRARLRRRPLLVFVGLVFVTGGASAGYVAMSGSRVSPAAVGIDIADQLVADSTTGMLHPGVRQVYQSRANLPIWFAASDRAAAVTTLRHADRDGLPLDDQLAALSAHADTAATVQSLAALDLALTDALLRLGDAMGRPRVDASDLYGINWTPAPPTPGDPASEMTSALSVPETSPEQALEAWASALRPSHPGYLRLRATLARELDLAEIPTLDRDLALGDSGAAVVHLHARLAVDEHAVDGVTFTEETAQALREVQRDAGVPVTGRLDGATRQSLNGRRSELIPLLTLNLEKWRWLPRDLGDLHIWVNVPRYELALREREGGRWVEAIRFRSVVGASDWQTPSFTDTLETIVFNPTWIVPASIQRESYGRVKGYVVRPPGPGNAMGRVKFLFPNDHAVYVHDTPTQWAFGVDDRARSHGCVRAADPEGLAREILTRTNGWDAERVAAIFDGPWRGPDGHRVDATVPVHLTYFTAEVDPDGRLRVWDDVYRRDGTLADALGLDRPDVSSALVASLIADRIGDEAAVAAQDEADAVQEDDTPRSVPQSGEAAQAPPIAPTPPVSAPSSELRPSSSDTMDVGRDSGVLLETGQR